MRFARRSIALGLLVSLGCQSRLGGDINVGETETGTVGDGDGDGDGDDSGDGDGDDDDSGDGDGDGDVYCDLARFPLIEPIWLEYLPQDPSPFFFEGLAMGADAIFSASFRVVDGYSSDAVITRRSLDGQIEWSVDAPNYAEQLDWDGQHVYYSTFVPWDGPSTVRRVTADGQLDESWSFEPDTTISDLNASGPSVLLTGEHNYDSDPSIYLNDVITYWLDKEDWQLPGGSGSDLFGEFSEWDRAGIVIPSASGGHIAAMTNLEYGTLSLRGYEGATLSLDADFPGTAHPSFMFERPEGLLVSVGPRTFSTMTAWLMRVDPDGNELWRRQYEPCGPVTTYFVDAAEGPNHFWGAMSFETAKDIYQSILIEFDFDGELLASYAFDDGLDGDVRWIWNVASNGNEVVIAGGTQLPDQTNIGWLARIQ